MGALPARGWTRGAAADRPAAFSIAQRWGDIEYSAVVDRFGNLFKGRHGRGGDPGDALPTREVLSAGVVAGHDYHHSYGSVGVALLGDASRPDWPLASSLASPAPGGRETTAGTPISHTWAAEQPGSGWELVGYECCVDGWSKSSRGDDIQYLSGYDRSPQPRPARTPLPATTTSLTFTPISAGHYPVHLRALLRHRSSGALRRSAFQGDHTCLVRPASLGGKKPRSGAD